MRTISLTATGAAVIATAGDLLLLRAATEAGATPPQPDMPALRRLLLGHYLGVLAIPLYALGYWQISRAIAPAGEGRARWMLYVGAYAAAIGGAVHGITALAIAASPAASRAASDPMVVLAPFADFLLPLWGVLGTLALAGSVLFAGAVRTGRTPFPASCAWINPATLVVAIAVGAAALPVLRPVVLPAGPNLAHIVFFGLATVVLWRTR